MSKMRLCKTIGIFCLVLSSICCLVIAGCDNSSSSSAIVQNGDGGDSTERSISIQFIVTNNSPNDLIRIETYSDEYEETISVEPCVAGDTKTLPIIKLTYPEGYHFRWRFFNNAGEFFQPEFNDSDVPFNLDAQIYAVSLNDVFGPNRVSYDDNTELITIEVTINDYDRIN